MWWQENSQFLVFACLCLSRYFCCHRAHCACALGVMPCLTPHLSSHSRLQPAAGRLAADAAVPSLQPATSSSCCLPRAGPGPAAAGAAASAVPSGQLPPAALHHAGLAAGPLQRPAWCPGSTWHLPAKARLHPAARQHHDTTTQWAQPIRPHSATFRAPGLRTARAWLPVRAECPLLAAAAWQPSPPRSRAVPRQKSRRKCSLVLRGEGRSDRAVHALNCIRFLV